METRYRYGKFISDLVGNVLIEFELFYLGGLRGRQHLERES